MDFSISHINEQVNRSQFRYAFLVDMLLIILTKLDVDKLNKQACGSSLGINCCFYKKPTYVKPPTNCSLNSLKTRANFPFDNSLW
jgi:hypothetical protein